MLGVKMKELSRPKYQGNNKDSIIEFLKKCGNERSVPLA